MTFCIFEFDDLHPNPEVDCLGLAEKLCSKYPKLILNFFVPAAYMGQELYLNEPWCKRLRALVNSGKVCLGVHSLYHTQEEFKYYDYKTAVAKIKLAESIFNASGLSFAKVFRGSHWGICEDTIKALIDLGYTHLYSHKNYNHLTDFYKDKIKIVHYNFNLADIWPNMENPIKNNIVIMHGHTHNVCSNGIFETYNKMLDILIANNFNCLRIDEV